MKGEVTKIVTLDIKQVSESLFDKIQSKRLYTYEDTILEEHLFQTDVIKEKCQEYGIVLNKEEQDSLLKIEVSCAQYDAAYFRIIQP